jgi:hypothetical protein
MEQEPAGRGGGVDALLEHDQVHLAFGEHRGDLGEMADRAGHPGQAGDDEFVAGSKVVQALVPFRTTREPPGGGIGPDPVAAGGAQCVKLRVVGLRSCGDPSVAVTRHA